MEASGRDPRSYEIIGAAMEVHRHCGRGLSEAIYSASLAVEFSLRGIPFDKEVDLPVSYKGHPLPCLFRADFVCYGDIIVELKAIPELTPREYGQIINYLRITNRPLGLIFNFGPNKLEYKRLIDSKLRD